MTLRLVAWCVLVWFLFPVNAYAYHYIFVFYEMKDKAFLIEMAHTFLENGLPVDPRHQGTRHDVANDVFKWLSDEQPTRNFYPVFSTDQGARARAQRRGELNGILLEISPDERAYNLIETIRNLDAVTINEGAERAALSSFFNSAIDGLSHDTLLTGMPPLATETDQDPVQTVVRGTNMRRHSYITEARESARRSGTMRMGPLPSRMVRI